MKKLLSGNEAIARGLYEAGVSFASAYPGTPSTEILENVARYGHRMKRLPSKRLSGHPWAVSGRLQR